MYHLSMTPVDNLQNKSYLGEIILLDVPTKKIVARGYGQFDPVRAKISASVVALASGHFKKILIILRSNEIYITPFTLYGKVFVEDVAIDIAYDLNAFLHWKHDDNLSIIHNLTVPLRKFNFISVIIKAQYTPDGVETTIYSEGIAAKLTRRAVTAKIDSAEYRDAVVNISTGYTIKRHSQNIRDNFHTQLESYIRYRFSCSNTVLRFSDAGKILLAFKLYWISHFDMIDCHISSILIGDNVVLQLVNNDLHSLSITDERYRSIINIRQPIHAHSLAKMTYFFLNPHGIKRLGSSSKIGLAFLRIIDFRFQADSLAFYMNLANLIFSLQSLAEGIAEREIHKSHRLTKQQTMDDIHKVLAVVRTLSPDISTEVRNFYLRSERDIYTLIARPTFMQSLTVAFEKLEIDIASYASMLKSIDKARRQIVHSEGYSVEFLLSILTDTAMQLSANEKGNQRLVVKEDGEVTQLYELLRLMTIRYFDKVAL